MSSRSAAPRGAGASLSAIDKGRRLEAFEHVEHALARVVRLARPRLHRPALASVGGPLIDPAAYATLLWIGDAPTCRLTDLAALLGVDVSTTSRQVSALELAGLVERRIDPEDQRARLLQLSDKGVALLVRARRAREEGIAALLKHWSPRDVNELARLLDRLAACLCEPVTGDPPLEATR